MAISDETIVGFLRAVFLDPKKVDQQKLAMVARAAADRLEALTAALPHMGEVRNEQLRAIQNSTLYQCSSCLDHYPEGSCYPADEVWALGDKVLCDECLDNEADGDSAIRIDKALASHEPAPKPEGEPKVWIIDKSNVSAAVAAIVERAKRGEIADSPPKTGRGPQELSEFLSSSEPAKDGPEVVGLVSGTGLAILDAGDAATLHPTTHPQAGVLTPLIRLSDYEALRAENERLRIERITAERDAADYMKRLNKAAGKLSIAENVIAELVKALEFYADVSKYPSPLTGGMGALWQDCGQRARNGLEAALKGQSNE